MSGWILLSVLLSSALHEGGSRQTAEPAEEREIVETWLCPLHRDEQATGPRRCPIDGREMVKVLLTYSYSCPMHPHIDEPGPGDCPICGMHLAVTTKELQWYCPDTPNELSATPGVCKESGLPMQRRAVAMAHGDHNPRHGGILFMAPNRYHHLEGALNEDGEFRLYLYNDFTQPIDARDFEARIGDERLRAEPSGDFLHLPLGVPESYPTEVVLHVRFPESSPDTSEDEEARFDFIFVDPEAAPTTDIALPEFRIPEAPAEIFEEILKRDARLKDLIGRGGWTELYIPALEAKELVLVLSAKEGERIAFPAKKLVRAAWLLDAFGDLGNREKVEKAYRLFEESVRELEAAHAQ